MAFRSMTMKNAPAFMIFSKLNIAPLHDEIIFKCQKRSQYCFFGIKNEKGIQKMAFKAMVV